MEINNVTVTTEKSQSEFTDGEADVFDLLCTALENLSHEERINAAPTEWPTSVLFAGDVGDNRTRIEIRAEVSPGAEEMLDVALIRTLEGTAYEMGKETSSIYHVFEA